MPLGSTDMENLDQDAVLAKSVIMRSQMPRKLEIVRRICKKSSKKSQK